MIRSRSRTPKSVEELAATLAECNSERTAVSVSGGDTLHAAGAALERDAVRLSTLRLDALIVHEFHDLTCAVQAGMRVAAFEAHLEAHGQFVPLDAPLRNDATVGGTIAAGWLGARRHLYGRARDLLIGTQVVLADGTVANAGGMVVKNVTGYDMSKLYAGSFGTLGVLTRVNFKTLPLPQCRRALIAPLPEGSRTRAIAQIAAMNVTPAATFCLEGFRKTVSGEDDVDGRIFILLEGSQSLVDRATLEARSSLGRAGVPRTTVVDSGALERFQSCLDACIAPLGERSLTFRVLGDPATAEERATALRDAAHRHELFTDLLFDVMNGDVYLRLSERDRRAFAEKIESADEGLRAVAPRRAIVSGDAPIRTALDPWGLPPESIEKMRALKAQFDPNRILNPGRFVGGI